MGRNTRATKYFKIENYEIYNYYFERMVNIARSQFTWSGLPDTCDSWYLEKVMLEGGKGSIYRVKGSDIWLSTDFVLKGQLSVYGLPTDIYGIGVNHNPIETDEWEIMWDNKTHSSLLPQIRFYAKQLTMLHQTFNLNLKQQNKPTVVITNDNRLLSNMNFFNEMDEYKPVLYVNSSFDMNAIQTLDLHVDYKGRDLLEAMEIIWGRFLSMCGIVPITSKKERMNNNELVMNSQSDLISLNSRMEDRIELCNKLNKNHGFNCSVNLASNIMEMSQFEPFTTVSGMMLDKTSGSKTTYDNLDKNETSKDNTPKGDES